MYHTYCSNYKWYNICYLFFAPTRYVCICTLPVHMYIFYSLLFFNFIFLLWLATPYFASNISINFKGKASPQKAHPVRFALTRLECLYFGAPRSGFDSIIISWQGTRVWDFYSSIIFRQYYYWATSALCFLRHTFYLNMVSYKKYMYGVPSKLLSLPPSFKSGDEP